MKTLFFVVLLFVTVPFFAQVQQSKLNELPALLEAKPHHGWAASFIGVHNNTLIMAGGSAFPDSKPWENGIKRYSDQILVYNDSEWKSNSKWSLPNPIAGGAVVSLSEGVFCTGGSNSDGISNQSFLITYTNEQAEITNMPSLPFPLKDHGMTTIGRKVYVIGGVTEKGYNLQMLQLDLNQLEKGWNSISEIPHALSHAMVVSQTDGTEQSLFIIGGRHKLKGQTSTTFSNQVWKYKPSNNCWIQKNDWTLKDGKSITLAAAAGIKTGASHILIVGGDDGSTFNQVEKAINRMKAFEGDERALAQQKRDSLWLHHAGFNQDILLYNTITDSWFSAGDLEAEAPAVTSAVMLQNKVIIPSGEVRPGIRSDQVITLDFARQEGFGFMNYVVLVLYFIGMLYLGFYFMKRENDEQDFFKAGGRIPWWAAGISIFATTLSAITFIAIPAKSYATDWRMLVFNLTIILVAPVVIKYYLPFFRRLNIGTAYEYLELRFNRSVRWMASLFFIIFMVTRIAVVLFLPSLALHAVTGFSVYWSIIVMGVVTIIYCTSGGIEAVVWGDVIQGIILMLGAILALAYMIFGIDGGIGGFIDVSMDNQKLFLLDFNMDWSKPVLWVVLLGGFANSLIAYTSDQSVVQRYMTTKDEKATSKSIWLNGIISIPVSVIFFLLGTGLYAFYSSKPEALSVSIPNLDAVFPHFIVSELPAGLAGLLIAAVFAAAMSTLSSNINSVSAVITSDFFDVLRPKAKGKSSMLVARLSGIIVGIFGIGMALVLATWDIASLWDQFNTFLGLLTGGLGALFVMGIFFKRISGIAAFIGVIVGFIALLWLRSHSPMSFLLYGAAGIAISVAVAYVLSFIWPQKKAIDKLTYNSEIKNVDSM